MLQQFQIVTNALVIHGQPRWDFSGLDAQNLFDNTKAQNGKWPGADGSQGTDE